MKLHHVRDTTARRLSTLHTSLYRLTGGRIGRRLVDNDMLLLTTVGRATGRPHRVPLLYLEDPYLEGRSPSACDAGPDRRGMAAQPAGGSGPRRPRLVVFASWGGRPTDPEWFVNLTATPQGEVQVGGSTWPVTASMAEGEDRVRWWQRAVAAYAGYETYQARTDRPIPVVFLDVE